jgi:hypothetical protein
MPATHQGSPLRIPARSTTFNACCRPPPTKQWPACSCLNLLSLPDLPHTLCFPAPSSVPSPPFIQPLNVRFSHSFPHPFVCQLVGPGLFGSFQRHQPAPGYCNRFIGRTSAFPIRPPRRSQPHLRYTSTIISRVPHTRSVSCSFCLDQLRPAPQEPDISIVRPSRSGLRFHPIHKPPPSPRLWKEPMNFRPTLKPSTTRSTYSIWVIGQKLACT